MYNRKPSLPEDTICRLLDSFDYTDLKAFKNAHLMLALVTKPNFNNYMVDADQAGIEICAKDFLAELEEAEQFLCKIPLDAMEKAKSTKAIEELYSAIERAKTPEAPTPGRK